MSKRIVLALSAAGLVMLLAALALLFGSSGQPERVGQAVASPPLGAQFAMRCWPPAKT